MPDLRVNGDEQAKDAQQGADQLSANRIDDLAGSLSEEDRSYLIMLSLKISLGKAEKVQTRIAPETIAGLAFGNITGHI
jgi:hypothetical protein